MTQLTTLLWKEWREARPYLLIGLGLFLGLPLIGEVEHVFHTARAFEVETSPWVIPLGGVLAVFVAVGVTTRDLRPRLEDFWRSRPILVHRWVAAKYGVSLGVVLLACGLPLAIEQASSRMPDAPVAVLTFMPFFWAATFSLAFLAGCLFARPAHAAALGLAAMLLLYAVPVILPPLSWMNVTDFNDLRAGGQTAWDQWLRLWGPRQFGFAGGMLGLSAIGAIASALAVRRGWRIESGRKVLYGLVAAAFLLLFASAAFQLANNLPLLQKVELPASERVASLRFEGAEGFVVTSQFRRPLGPVAGKDVGIDRYRYRSISARSGGIVVGDPVDYPTDPYVVWRYDLLNHGFAYRLDYANPPGREDVWVVSLLTIDPRHGTATQLRLWEQRIGQYAATAQLYLAGDRLYVVGQRLALLDVGKPDQPWIVSEVPLGATAEPPRRLNAEQHLVVKLLSLPGLSPERRLEATLAFNSPYDRAGFDGRLLCRWDDGLSGYRLTRLDPSSAAFERAGGFRPTALQRWANRFAEGAAAITPDGLVYVSGWGGDSAFNSAVTIVDTRGPRPMRVVGHFAAPGAEMVCPLPDGRAVVGGGNHLWLVGGPPRRVDG